MRGGLLLLTFIAVYSIPAAQNVSLPNADKYEYEQTYASEVEDLSTEFNTEGNSSVASLPYEQEDEFEGDPNNKTQPQSDSGGCGPPPTIERTRIISGKNSTYGPGSAVTYSCEFGYVTDGLKQVRCTFSADSGELKWSQLEMRCTPRSCGDPGDVDKAKRTGSLFNFPNKVSYECEEGYEMKGNRDRYCQPSGTWSGKLPKCQKLSCKPPSNIQNGRVSYTSLDFGSKLQYTCDPGYILKSHSTRYCVGNKTWSGKDPICKDSQCDLPIKPNGGSFQLIGEKPVADTRVIFKCDANKILLGSKVSICMENGEWTFPPPMCLDPCSIPTVQRGRIKKRWTEVPVGSLVNSKDDLYLSCDRNYEPLGQNRKEALVKCANGIWEDVPRCEPASCRNQPPRIHYGRAKHYSPNHSSLVEYECQEGLILTESSKVECLFGTWTGEPPKCRGTFCQDDYPEIKNGRKTYMDNKNGGYVYYGCSKYFEKTKEGNITCSSGTWIGITPVCSDTRCYYSKLPHSGLKRVNEIFYNGTSFTPVCESGYSATEPKGRLKCDKGEWKGALPPCVPADSSNSKTTIRPSTVTSRPNVALPASVGPPRSDEVCSCTYFNYDPNLVGVSGHEVLQNGTRVKENCRVKFYCLHFGFLILRGTPELVCDKCKDWRFSEYPQCVYPTEKDVVLRFSGENFYVSHTDEIDEIVLHEGQSLHISCYSFHYDVGVKWQDPRAQGISYREQILNNQHGQYRLAMVLEVHANAQNSGVYSCRANVNQPRARMIRIKVLAIECPNIEETEHLSVEYENGQRAHNSRVFFSCKKEGARLAGDSSLTCQPSGQWSGEVPQCHHPVECPDLVETDGLTIDYTRKDRFVGSSVAFHCFAPRIRVGESHASCREDGLWSNPVPHCLLPNCSLDALFRSFSEDVTADSRERQSDIMPYNSTVTLRCKKEELTLVGGKVATCKDGNWTVPDSKCISGCAPIQPPDSHLKIDPLQESYGVGEAITLSCPAGMALSSDVERLMCLFEGWSDTQLPSCLQKEA